MSVHVKSSSRLADLVHYKVKVLTTDGRVYVGELLAFDRHMNMVLGDCVEQRLPKSQLQKAKTGTAAGSSVEVGEMRSEKRTLGLTVLRGEHVLSTVVEDKPSVTKRERLQQQKQQQKRVSKQRNLNKKSRGSNANGPGRTPPQGHESNPIPKPRRFQPPPGFKRKE